MPVECLSIMGDSCRLTPLFGDVVPLLQNATSQPTETMDGRRDDKEEKQVVELS